jgi:hypothetical protein
MKRAVVAGCIAAGVFGAVLTGATAAEKKAPKHEIAKIMKEGHKGDTALVQKVIKGQASDEEKKLLVEYYQSLAEYTPKKGTAASWKTKTTALITAAEGVVAGKPQATNALKQAVNCKACHTAHKPD